MRAINERLSDAAKKGDAVKVKALLREQGGDVLDANEFVMTALMWAAQRGQDDCVSSCYQ